ncbi:hypothetical protein CDL15_Pgr002668 [Punica granatum]|uniref:Uncharacterized protein n=1 Tax=Punica granatum TaxID=22663 RepID=A0A218WEX8_PUNGR|nr:hypothetical protein CDL15_Pgr002668 [Punica granatum]
MWSDSSSSVAERFLRVREVRRLWDTSLTQDLYFPDHPTDKKRAFSATSTYVAQFYSHDPAPVSRPRAALTPWAPPTAAPEAESSAQAAMSMELHTIREE